MNDGVGLDRPARSDREKRMVKPQTFWFAQLQRLGPFLVVLFVLAQAAGIAPLISTHIQHALYGLRLIDSRDFWDSRRESKQLAYNVMIRLRERS